VRLADALDGVKLLGFDTAPLIYLVEAHPHYGEIMMEIVRQMTAGRLNGITSVVSRGEVLVQPMIRGEVFLQRRFRQVLLRSTGFRTVDIDVTAAELAARRRATHGMRLPDALQIAVALREGCEAFLTNDRRLRRVTELRVLLLDDLEM